MTFDEWYVKLYQARGFLSSDAELREAWEAATKAAYEECAKVCETVGAQDVQGCSSDYNEGRQMAAVVCANTLRAL